MRYPSSSHLQEITLWKKPPHVRSFFCQFAVIPTYKNSPKQIGKWLVLEASHSAGPRAEKVWNRPMRHRRNRSKGGVLTTPMLLCKLWVTILRLSEVCGSDVRSNRWHRTPVYSEGLKCGERKIVTHRLIIVRFLHNEPRFENNALGLSFEKTRRFLGLLSA